MQHVLALSVLVLAAACDGTAPPTGPELTGESFTISWGPITAAPGEEGTRCAVLDLGNTEAVYIHELRNQLAESSHHLVVYRVDDPAAQPTPEPVICEPFAGALSPSASDAPLMITQQKDDRLALPPGVAYAFAANQKIRLELHYFNATDSEAVVDATSTFSVGTPELIRDEASFLFIGTPDIELLPGATATIGAYFTLPEALADAQFYAITGHTHQLGTDVRVATSPARDGERTSVYEVPFLWSEPPTERHDPPFRVPEGGGFDFQCDFRNTTNETVEFGESANAEMCFFWAYYYPSQGARMCVHSTLVNAPDGIDVCCPGERGDQLAEFVCRIIAEG